MDRCKTCQYYDRQGRAAERGGVAGQCRRQAPALSPINQKSYMIEGVWPTVRDDDWCGEWKAHVRRVDPARVGEALATSIPSPLGANGARPSFTLPPRVPHEPRSVTPAAVVASVAAAPAND